jgi:ferrous iron transport protein A
MSLQRVSEEVPRSMSSSKSEGRNSAWDRLIETKGRPRVPITLVPPGSEVRLIEIRGGRMLVQRLSNLGFTLGGKMKIVHTHNPGPVLVEVKNSRIALGRGVSMKIIVEEV